MTIQERLEFIRAGYSRDEIAEFEHGAQEPEHGAQEQEHGAQEQEHGAQEPEHGAQEPEHGEQEQESDAPAWANALKASIDALTKVTQTRNALLDDMGDAADTATKAQDALATYLTGKGKNQMPGNAIWKGEKLNVW